jgi:hypothetical protein
MAEFCKECMEELFPVKVTKVSEDLDLCEHCGQFKPVAIDMKRLMDCEVCGKETFDYKVVSSALGPVSFRYCPDCLESGAEPYNMLVSTVAMIGGVDAVAPWFKKVIETSCKAANKSEEEFLKDVKESERIMAEEFEYFKKAEKEITEDFDC